jgi:hypothetical protein
LTIPCESVHTDALETSKQLLRSAGKQQYTCDTDETAEVFEVLEVLEPFEEFDAAD